MKRCLLLFLTSAISAALLSLTPALASAQQALTWDQVKAHFEAANPTLKADALTIDEMKAEEITAYLRPNPQFAAATDGTQIAPHGGVWQPLSGAQAQGPSATCTSANTSANFAKRAAKEGTQITASQHQDLKRNLLFTLRSAFVQTLQAKTVLQLAKEDLDYYDHIIQISRDRFNAGDIAQIDLDRIELLRVQYEAEIQSAIVNLRTAKIQLLQLLDDHTPVEQFDVTGPFDFSDDLKPLEEFRQVALDARPDLRAALEAAQAGRHQPQAGSRQRIHRSDIQRLVHVESVLQQPL